MARIWPRLAQSRIPTIETAKIVAVVAEALHFAHLQGLVHRDIKPSNLLLDKSGKPFVSDFGSALRESDIGRGPRYVGTPAYMSPEQARGEGHRVNGQSDIFSLGIVLYELLTGRRPFQGDTPNDRLASIVHDEVRPPRQVTDDISRELERICLKALSKRAAERYTTARDMAEDLRRWLLTRSAKEEQPPGGVGDTFVPAATAPNGGESNSSASPSTQKPDTGTLLRPPSSDRPPVRIVPKGLRAFDAKDTEFFLDLLPGPRDCDDLPESIRFWQSKINPGDADDSFAVGLIYGPSGCGKSSFVKAGLLPRLSKSVMKVYVEASAEETEQRLLRGLRKHLPRLGNDTGLAEALADLRRGQYLDSGDKVRLVIDQFEQRLHSHGGETDAELIRALRQCDGVHVQCIIMVRDDFWLAVSRFMQELEIRVMEGENSRMVDLFDVRHARKVLAALGTALGTLGPTAANRTREQDAFLDRAIASLAQDGKVVSIRLSLFAEMVKNKPWTSATLRELGGAEGVGVAFLEETFGSSTAPPHHRLQQKPAEKVLASLLPDAGTDLKGHMRSREELLAVSGCGNRPNRFDDVMTLLDAELRLVTPTDSEDIDADEASPTAPTTQREKRYQLTHDYLVPSLRTWLSRKQMSTRGGRAELRLADLAAHWKQRPENRRLPSLGEFLQIRFYTRAAVRTEAQRKMMFASARYYVLRAVAATVVAVLASYSAYYAFGYFKAKEMNNRLMAAQIDKVKETLDEIAPYRRWIDPLLRQDLSLADDDKRLRASLALLPNDPAQVDYLYGRLIRARPEEIDLIRRQLLPYKEQLTDKLWGVAKSPNGDRDLQLLCAASALALYSPDDPKWHDITADLSIALSKVRPFYVKYWTDALSNVYDKLAEPLGSIAIDRDPNRTASERLAATNILAAYAAGRADVLIAVLLDGDEDQFKIIIPLLSRLGAEPQSKLIAVLANSPPAGADISKAEVLVRRQAVAGAALLRLGLPDYVWPMLKRSPPDDPTVRSWLIHLAHSSGVNVHSIIDRWQKETDVSARRALLLMLGEYRPDELSADELQRMAAQLLKTFTEEHDAGLHAAAQWLAHKWRCDVGLPAVMAKPGCKRSPNCKQRRPKIGRSGISTARATRLLSSTVTSLSRWGRRRTILTGTITRSRIGSISAAATPLLPTR